MIRAAFLRVYLREPVSAVLDVQADHEDGSFLQDRFRLFEEPTGEEPLVAEWRGRRMACPRYYRLRSLEGLVAFHNAYADIGAGLIIPERVVRRASEELSRLDERHPGVRSHILTSPWHVPLRWFVAFDPSERLLREEVVGWSIRYRTSLPEATDRVVAALDTLRGSGVDDVMAGDLDELRLWLEDFPATAMVELDYADVAGLFDDTELIFDESAGDVQAALEALDRGDLTHAGEHYGAVARRWAPKIAVSYSN